MLVGVEMDEDFMIAVLLLAAYFAAGLGLGLLYFYGLWRNAHLFANGARIATVIALSVGRFVLLAAVLVPVARQGALPLLLTALGIVIARFVSVRYLRNAAAMPLASQHREGPA
ncbi:MAG: conserved rane protein of unknown function [Variovorax sp.]|nr:conserved rane protein of unknown function [Variovorax sp.]